MAGEIAVTLIVGDDKNNIRPCSFSESRENRRNKAERSKGGQKVTDGCGGNGKSVLNSLFHKGKNRRVK